MREKNFADLANLARIDKEDIMLTQREFGERLKATRKKLKLTQKTMSEKINVGQGTLSSWEDGAKVPNILSIINLCEAFDLSLDDLLDLKIEKK